jgi:FRG domain
VIQHYGLWPTPLLDFTTSLRIAASFAFDFDPSRRGEPPTLYAVGVRRLRSDLMALSSDDDQERADSMLTIRLNSVCPPSAKRAHFQDAVLVGHYPFERHHVDDPELSNSEAILVAKCRLMNSKGAFWRSKRAFWRKKDFPIHSRRSLLPSPAADPLLRDLRASIAYDLDDSGLVSVRRS